MCLKVCLLIKCPPPGAVKMCQFHRPDADLWPRQVRQVNGRFTTAVCWQAPTRSHTSSEAAVPHVRDFLWHSCVNNPGGLVGWGGGVQEGWSVPRVYLCVVPKGFNIQSFAPLGQADTMQRKCFKKRWTDEKGDTQDRRSVKSVVLAFCDVKISVSMLSYQLPWREHVLLPSHHHRNTFPLLGAAQHGYKFLLAAACHVYTVHLHTHRSGLKWSVLSTAGALNYYTANIKCLRIRWSCYILWTTQHPFFRYHLWDCWEVDANSNLHFSFKELHQYYW